MRRLLIANRGEIAVRLVRACTDEGITSVVTHVDADADALSVRLADEAIRLGDGSPSAYLDVAAVVAAARAAHVDAVHPGYGYLSESAELAAAVEDAGLIWVGPSPEAISRLGDKVSAREVAASIGAPLAHGTPGPLSDPADARSFVELHGLPVIIKAAHGGGGRGMRVVRDLSELDEAFGAATREATAAFGRGECFVEQYLDRPRHVETQCLADMHGNVVVLSTRDCTVQRRHQKLIEEAPAPFLDDAQTAVLVATSKKLLAEVGYVGAATCEFLLAADGSIAFLEVNTRLQVEHPVTEEVVGIDVVREMLRIARGEPLGYDDPTVRGHAIEFRINAEDAGAGFVPAGGKLRRLRPPGGPGVRFDAGYEEGDEVPALFDSLIGKLIVWGRDRGQALERARRALRELRVEGVPTLVPAHLQIVSAQDFATLEPPLRVHTTWVQDTADLDVAPWADGEDRVDDRGNTMPVEGTELVVDVDGRRLTMTVHAVRPAGRTDRGRSVAAARAGVISDHGSVVAPMQGVVIRVLAQEGEAVERGQAIAVLEAMKMEQVVLAPRAGIVGDLCIAAGDTVSRHQVLARIT
ncbi:biotin carboxylase N-terminal domain-containing protein [Nonomuraea sp. NPDC050783]|uniref:acetyl/propionyl/methylcrotonyl-CoA carboxylase subunit alpha n=1 Tax=Nonomuraea sp. NPDC050783 TaxID=3154634 RepID=UPI0034668330